MKWKADRSLNLHYSGKINCTLKANTPRKLKDKEIPWVGVKKGRFKKEEKNYYLVNRNRNIQHKPEKVHRRQRQNLVGCMLQDLPIILSLNTRWYLVIFKKTLKYTHRHAEKLCKSVGMRGMESRYMSWENWYNYWDFTVSNLASIDDKFIPSSFYGTKRPQPSNLSEIFSL